MKAMLTATMVLASLTSFNSEAGFSFGKKKEEAKVVNYLNTEDSSKERTALQEQALIKLQAEMIEKFNEIELDITRGDTKSAFLKSKSVLDNVKIKTGIDPKIRIQESFLAPVIFSKGVKQLMDLSEAQRNIVIRTISGFRGGLYIDIMNLSKRTTLLYIKAFQLELMKNGGLTEEDRKKIVNDLVKAAVMPMPVEDKNGVKIFAFEEDVANEDHTYIFNRELKMFLLENKSLNFTEENFIKAKNAYKNEVLSGSKNGSSAGAYSYQEGLKCMDNASYIQVYETRYDAQSMCFDKTFDQVNNYSDCIVLASKLSVYDSKHEAQGKCFYRFN